MARSQEYVDYVVDQLSGFGDVGTRKMFGGVGLFRHGIMFALIAHDTLYFKVDEHSKRAYENKGSGPFRPFDTRDTVMSYYEVPEDILEDEILLADWADRAWTVALELKKTRKVSEAQEHRRA